MKQKTFLLGLAWNPSPNQKEMDVSPVPAISDLKDFNCNIGRTNCFWLGPGSQVGCVWPWDRGRPKNRRKENTVARAGQATDVRGLFLVSGYRQLLCCVFSYWRSRHLNDASDVA